MNPNNPQHHRILAVSPSTRGFGFALSEGQETLVDWGVKSVQGDKNRRCLTKIAELIAHYRPDVLLLEDLSEKHSRRSLRIRTLGRHIINLATELNVRVVLLSRAQIRQVFFADGEGTRHASAQILAQRFPEELGPRLPPKRKPWQSEDSRMDLFAAVALIVGFRARKTIKASPKPHFDGPKPRLLD